MEHRQDGGGADPRTDQEDCGVGAIEDERAARRRDVELVADGESVVDIAAGDPVALALDGDPVVTGVGRSRQ
jgi:hypothetical protein